VAGGVGSGVGTRGFTENHRLSSDRVDRISMGDVNPHRIHAASCAMSGHVSYTAQQIAFFGMVDRRINKQNALRKAGIVVPKLARNPLAAQKTPRKEDSHSFDYSIPTGRKDLKDWHKWNYPDTDFGLVGKFNTQKETYANFVGTLEDYKNNVAAAEKAREEVRLAAAATQRGDATARNTGRESARLSVREEEEEFTQRTSRPLEGGLDSHSIKTFKVLGGPHPEVLDKWRAQRAAEYIKKLKDPLDPPPKKQVVHPRTMLPAGTYHEPIPDYGDANKPPTKAHKKVLGAPVSHAKVKDINSMKASLADLMGALDQTEQELDRQKLTLKLNARKKASYEAPATGRVSARSTDLLRSP